MAKLALRDTLAVHLRGADLERAVQQVAAQRRSVLWALAAAMLGVVVLELHLPSVVLENARMAVELIPVVLVRLVGYLVAALLLTSRSNDRFGFGLALGLGLVQFVLKLYAMGTAPVLDPMALAADGGLAALHLVLAAAALKASLAYPGASRRFPWIIGAAGSLLCIVLLPLAAQSLWQPPADTAAPIKSPAVATPQLVAGVRALAECVRGVRQTTGTVPTDSAAFQAACAAVLTDRTGWSLRYEPLSDSTGARTAFRFYVEQGETDTMLAGAFAADSSGALTRTRRIPAAP
jgi:hypothetical protein